jgi:PAS domain S-box-containing protein
MSIVFGEEPDSAGLFVTNHGAAGAGDDVAQAKRLRLLEMAEQIAGLGYWRFGLNDNAIEWSDEVYRIHGVDPETFHLTSATALDFYPARERRRIEQAVREATLTREGFDLEVTLTRPCGETRWVTIRGACELNVAGPPTALYGVFQDVTESRRAEAEQKKSAERFARIIERLPAGAVHVQAGVLSVNAEVERITGYSRQELNSLEAWFTLLNGDKAPKLIERYHQRRREGFAETVTAAIRRRDGEERVIEYRACDDTVGEIWILHDVTERDAIQAELVQARDRAEAAANTKSQFLANMSHELRTPLTAIVGFSGLLEAHDALPPQARHWVARVEEASKALLAIVNDVLDFSKLEDGSVSLDLEPFDPRKLAADTAALVADQAERKAVALNIDIHGEVPAYVLGDTGRIRQVLLNLISNAVKFTPRGAIDVRIHPLCDRLRFAVTDTGIGITDDAVGQLFQRFVQADGSISRQFGGTGLGLAISKRLVEMMGGEIGVDSQLGQGSTFWFTVPLPEAGPCAPDLMETEIEQASGLNILLVEDTEANQELVTTILRAAGIEVDVAGHGGEAVEAIKLRSYDMILMDVHMPVLGGVEATRIIRGLGGAAAETPIIALSANVLPEQVEAYRRAGMDAHLGKPINPRDMLATISHWAGQTHIARDGARAGVKAKAG